jgi:hypothetical protein
MSGRGGAPAAILEPMERPAAAGPSAEQAAGPGRAVEPPPAAAGRGEPRRSSAVAGRSPAGAPVEVLSGSDGVGTAALDAPSLALGR